MPTTNTIKFKIFKNLILFLVFVSLLTFPLRVANGDSTIIGDILETVVYNVSKWIIQIFAFVFSNLVKAATLIFGMTLDLTLRPDLVNVKEAATVPWGIVRDFANLIIVFSLLIIAFGFILDIESFDAKKSFFYFIIIALIVNYSMLFTGALYDFSNFLISVIYQGLNVVSLSNVFSNFSKIAPTDFANPQYLTETFLASVLEDYKTIYNTPNAPAADTQVIINAFKKFKEQIKESQTTAEMTGAIEIIANATLNLVMLFIFSSSLIAIFLALSFIFVLRIAYFIFLIGISPLAFAFLILPWTRSYYKKWGSTLITWTILPVLVLFFVYIALLVGETLGCLGRPETCTASSTIPLTVTSPYVAFQNIFLVVLIFLAISFAKNLSSQAVDVGMTVGKWFTKFLGRTAPSYAARWVGAKTMGRTFKNWGNRAEARFGKDSIITKGIRAITSPVTKEYDRQIGNKISAIEKSYDEYKKMPTDPNNWNRFVKNISNYKELDRDVQLKILDILNKDKGVKNKLFSDNLSRFKEIVDTEKAITGEAPDFVGIVKFAIDNNINDSNITDPKNQRLLEAKIIDYYEKHPDEIPKTDKQLDDYEIKIFRELAKITNRNEVVNLITRGMGSAGFKNPERIKSVISRELVEKTLDQIKSLGFDEDTIHKFISSIRHSAFGRVAWDMHKIGTSPTTGKFIIN